jgi:catechol 2,3-dioxygenase-like lactoylglutathione lyase family enzyme
MITPTALSETPLLAGRAIVQACWIVPALEPAIARWRAAFGIGPWLVVDSKGTVDKLYRGRPTDIEYRAALVQSGEIQVELIEQTTPGASCFRDVVPEGRIGFHHVAFIADDYEAELDRFKSQGFAVAYQAGFGDMRFAQIDTADILGFMVEVFEDKAALHQSMGLVRSLSAGWDGVTNPVRTIEEILGASAPIAAP